MDLPRVYHKHSPRLDLTTCEHPGPLLSEAGACCFRQGPSGLGTHKAATAKYWPWLEKFPDRKPEQSYAGPLSSGTGAH